MSDRKMPRSSLVAVLRQSLLRHASIGSVSSIRLTPQMLGADRRTCRIYFSKKATVKAWILNPFLSFFFFFGGVLSIKLFKYNF